MRYKPIQVIHTHVVVKKTHAGVFLTLVFLAHSKNELMRWRGVCRSSVCLSVNFFAGIATTTPKIARSLPNLHRMVSTWARIHVVLKVEVKVKGHVIRALLCRSRKSLLVAGKWPDCDQTYTRWSPGQRESRMCSRSRSRSKVT